MRFCCCGSVCRVGTAVRLLHLLITVLVFYVLTATETTDLHSAWISKSGYFFGFLSLAIVSSVLYLLASLLDPGFLPKPDIKKEVLASFTNSSKSTLEGSADKLSVMEAGSPKLDMSLPPAEPDSSSGAAPHGDGGQYCRVCRHMRPMRAKHCFTCGHCVRRFDHHCPWLGNCVGERNHRFFWFFLVVETALTAWGVAIAWSGISLKSGEWFQANLLIFLSLLATFLCTIIVGLLFLYHSYLMLTGQSTWEQASRYRIHYLKDLPDFSNPFNEGCICNVLRFMFQARPRDWETLYLTRTTPTLVQR